MERLPRKKPIPWRRLKAIRRLMSEILNFFNIGSTNISMKIPSTFFTTLMVMNCSWYQP